MPKRKNKSRIRDEDKSRSEKRLKQDDELNNPIAEVFIKADLSSSDSSTSGSDSSSSDDSSYYRKKRLSKKKKKSRSGKRSFRKLQNQIDLFQRNVDIKLNYLESLLQTLVKNQEGGQSTLMPSPSLPVQANVFVNKQKLSGKPLKGPAPDFMISSASTLTEKTKVHPKIDAKKLEIPSFPITDYEFVFDLDKLLTSNAEYRQAVASHLNLYAVNFDSQQKDFYRAKCIMFFM